MGALPCLLGRPWIHSECWCCRLPRAMQYLLEVQARRARLCARNLSTPTNQAHGEQLPLLSLSDSDHATHSVGRRPMGGTILAPRSTRPDLKVYMFSVQRHGRSRTANEVQAAYGLPWCCTPSNVLRRVLWKRPYALGMKLQQKLQRMAKLVFLSTHPGVACLVAKAGTSPPDVRASGRVGAADPDTVIMGAVC